jgi:tetratricopeptide (TPR) repeat protein
MHRYLAAVIFVIILGAAPLFAENCTPQSYKSLVSEGKAADEAHQWDNSVKVYSRILSECAPLVNKVDLVKAYDALSVAQLMNENYSAAIDNAKKCLELDNRYNSCMMTAAKGYESLGDKDMAISFARSAVEVGAYDEYSSAVVILAKDFLKRLAQSNR